MQFMVRERGFQMDGFDFIIVLFWLYFIRTFKKDQYKCVLATHGTLYIHSIIIIIIKAYSNAYIHSKAYTQHSDGVFNRIYEHANRNLSRLICLPSSRLPHRSFREQRRVPAILRALNRWGFTRRFPDIMFWTVVVRMPFARYKYLHAHMLTNISTHDVA